ncbi:MAG TPA: potassium transporter TrkG [Phycisphaerales bacterium]|nr:potassium transporter TrkG [Phycisphaerales bacterium]
MAVRDPRVADSPSEPKPSAATARGVRAFLIRLWRLKMIFLRKLFRRWMRVWLNLRPPQQLVLGFASYMVIGVLLLTLPFAQKVPCGLIDNLFNVSSAISTTGLTTISVADSYTFFGQFVILALFQLGGVGYMTISSVIIQARGNSLSQSRMNVLGAGFAVPHYFVLNRFIVHVVVFTFFTELIGALLLWWRFASLHVPDALWSAVFHSVSAFATAGFSLNNDSLAPFVNDWFVNAVIAVLCYLGAIGFIVVQDVWYSIKFRQHLITFTSQSILFLTALIFIVGTIIFYFVEPSVREMPFGEGVMAAAFQVMTASSTAGFNTIPIGPLSRAALLIIMVAMLIGASPSGTGGGIKTTTVTALFANVTSSLRGRTQVVWLNREIPLVRLHSAFAAATIYLVLLVVGVLSLCITERHDFLPIVFEASSAIGTVGLSMGITADLSILGKLMITFLMFAGRCGPLSLGLALLRPVSEQEEIRGDDLAV